MTKQVLHRSMVRIASMVLLAIVWVAFPLPGRAIHCNPRGCPQAPPPPRLSRARLTRIVEYYLATTPPVVRFVLRQPVGSRPSAAYGDLVRAGFLHIIDGKPGQGSGPIYDLTERGTREIASGFFIKGSQYDPAADFVDIPVGQFRYVPGSAVLAHHDLEKPDPDYQYNLSDVRIGLPEVTFKYSFSGNTNVPTLLRLGPAKDWKIADYRRPQPDLRDVGRARKETLPLRLCHSQWFVREFPPFFRAQCSNA